MPKTQRRPGVRSVIRKEPALKGVEGAYCLAIDLGTTKRDETFCCSDEATFWETYFPSMSLRGKSIALGPKRLPEPETIARFLAEQLGSEPRQLADFALWLRDVATPKQVLEVLKQLRS